MACNAVAQQDKFSDSDYSDMLTRVDHYQPTSPPPMSSDPEAESQYSDGMDAPRTVSREGSVALRHPTPDLQSLRGAYVSNVERLEQSAERLSLSSDIGEEIRKMKLEQRKSESRQSSVLRSPIAEREGSPPEPPLHRQFSYRYGSHASNSIVGTNNVARSGGFSPAAYFVSPRSSVRSGSCSHHNSVNGRTTSQAARLAQLTEPEKEGRPLDSPISTRLAQRSASPDSSIGALRVTNEPQYNLDGVEIPHILPEVSGPVDEMPDLRTSTETYRQTNGLFSDFDGVHTEPHADALMALENTANRRRSSQPLPERPQSYFEPPPGENMVYYPAPVPMMLNLPKRLSKIPAAARRDKRRSQLLGSLPVDARKSAAWLPDTLGTQETTLHPADEDQVLDPRNTNRRTLPDMPPQLRATVFFDYPATQQDVEVKGESAMATLDSILDASAFAPVSAFTDHPIAGRVGSEIYGRAPARSRASHVPIEVVEPKQRRSTINLLTKRNSNSDLLTDRKKRNNSLLSLGNYFGKRKSSAQPLADAGEHQAVETADLNDEEVSLQPADDDHHENGENQEDEFHDAQEEVELEEETELQEGEEISLQPTTLLAELQLRKQQQKQRNRTAATAFPNGMHSTLLQLDAVAQVQKQARRQKHTQLAWEDPGIQHYGPENEDDEDVPLGMLFPGRKPNINEKSRLLDENRPLGLIARRDMEDNEPLSHRRARLRGEDLSIRQPSFDKRGPMYPPNNPNTLETPVDEGVENQEDLHETLAQRIKRIKATQIPKQTHPVSGDFASEMLSQFGGLSPVHQPQESQPQETRATTKTPEILEEETLGQRRRRLQAEATSKSRNPSGDTTANTTAPTTRPQLSNRRSMADILSAHPAAGAGAGIRTPSGGVRTLSNELKFAPAPATRNTPWAINQTRQASMGQLPMASGLGAAQMHPMMQMGQRPGGAVDKGQRDMIDRWRQSVMY